MQLVNLFTQPHGFITTVILSGIKYIGYLLGFGTVMNLLGMGKIFDYIIKIFAKVLGYMIGFIAVKLYIFVIKPLKVRNL